MNGYKAFYSGRETEVYASSTHEAWKLAVAKLGVSAKKAYLVSVVLCEKDGVTVSHSTAEFG